MQFDTADLAPMEADGSLVRVIVHEMGHVLGFGTIWDRLGLRQGAGTINPTFTGPNAMREFGALQGLTTPVPVSVANTGGPGTRDAHWREAVFGNELLTGFKFGKRRDSVRPVTVPQQMNVPDDFSLLLEAVAGKRPPRHKAVAIAAEGVAHQHEVPSPAGLGLPDVGQLVEKEGL